MLISSDNAMRLSLARGLWKWEPHPTQREWLLCDARTKVASCGRRWGKTEAAAIDAITFALMRPGSVQMIVAPTYDQSQIAKGATMRAVTGDRLLTRVRFGRGVRFGTPAEILTGGVDLGTQGPSGCPGIRPRPSAARLAGCSSSASIGSARSPDPWRGRIQRLC